METEKEQDDHEVDEHEFLLRDLKCESMGQENPNRLIERSRSNFSGAALSDLLC